MAPIGRLLGVALAIGVALTAQAEDRLPIFDVHLHYSRPAWSLLSADRVADTLRAAGVPRALVSSTPDDGSLMLARADPARFAVALRPYRDGADTGDWHRDETVVEYVAGRLGLVAYAAIGEFHLFDAAAAAAPAVRRLATLATERGLLLYVHSSAGPVEALFAGAPQSRILWAHAGMSDGPATVRRLLDRHPNLWTEVSFRAGDIAPDGRLDPVWREVFLAHPDRFMIGTDTYVNNRWTSYGELVEQHRRWLAQLPAETGRAIAYRNATRLFGGGEAFPPPDAAEGGR